MRYSINIDRENLAMAQGYDIDVSYKDLCAVCNAVRYLKVANAFDVLDNIIGMHTPVRFKRYNRYMGSRHELGGQKGAFPMKAAKEVKKVMTNAMANSKSKGMDADSLFVVHASANKTRIESRRPSKGSRSWGRGMYGLSSATHSDIEYAKIEIALANSDDKALTENMKHSIQSRSKVTEAKPKQQMPKQAPKPKKKEQTAAKQEAKKQK
jgi:large subunit ribosomal protein L22